MLNSSDSGVSPGMPLEYWDSVRMSANPPLHVYVAVVDNGLLARYRAAPCVFTPNGFADLRRECIRYFQAKDVHGWIEFHPEVPGDADKFYGWEQI